MGAVVITIFGNNLTGSVELFTTRRDCLATMQSFKYYFKYIIVETFNSLKEYNVNSCLFLRD